MRHHWPEYAIEAVGLALFMVSAAGFAVLLQHPASAVRMDLADPVVRRVLMGLAMAGTSAALVYSPWGARSGAHFNPSVTLAFARLGRIDGRDARWYIAAQFLGGVAGIAIAQMVFGAAVADPAVAYVATRPGPGGRLVAFGAETLISFVLMTVVLAFSSSRRLARGTGLAAAALVALYITFEEPFSGMSMNPARSFGPALLSGRLDGIWIYLTAPPVGMLAAAELFVRTRGWHAALCAKLYHPVGARCIFNCRYGGQMA